MTISDLLQTTQNELKNKLYEYLKQNGYEGRIINTDDYLLCEGDIGIMLVSHLDTVHKVLPSQIFIDKEKNVMWSPEGIGGDDRAGIFGITQIIKDCKPYLLFTTDEEIGGIGAKKFTEEYKIALNKKVKYIVELDRRGNKQAVFYDCGNKKFKDYILSFGFKEYYGSFSDISVLSPAYDIASVNVSAGYYNEHTKQEYINLNDLKNTVEIVKKMVIDIKNADFFDYQEEQRYYYKNYTTTKEKKDEKKKNKIYNSYEYELYKNDYYQLKDIDFEELYGFKKPSTFQAFLDCVEV